MKKSLIILLLLISVFSARSQSVVINQLDEVLLSDVKLHRNSRGQQVTVLNDSTLQENPLLLTSLLKFNTPIYFRETGYGMVSSASFRGTSASQTAVIWNGININSQFNGQTDFNTLLTAAYDNIAVRGGGGSVLYGSGAIGGSVHLNNGLRFNRGFRNGFRLEAGSFDTYSGHYKSEYSTAKTSLQLSALHHRSENHFPYPGTEKHNENGDFEHTGFDLAAARILNSRNTVHVFANYFNGERGFSGTLTAPSKSKYENRDFRSLVNWKNYSGAFTSDVKLAFLEENYRYYENRQRENYDFGNAKRGIAKYDLAYRWSDAIRLNSVFEYEHTYGEGANVDGNSRNIGALALLFNHDLGKFTYELSGRREITDTYQSPFLYSLSAIYAITDTYGLRMNISRNFRIPTYNDLFWSAGGNPDLEPEVSLQGELGQDLVLGNFDLSLTAYLMEIDNLLRWVPNSDGIWRPENTRSVRNYGIEATGGWQKVVGSHHVKLNSAYAYTKSWDLILEKSLIFVPEHKITSSAAYGKGRFTGYFQFLYNGSVFTSSDNNYELDAYSLWNVGFSYDVLKNDRGVIGFQLHNLFNTSYQSMPSRPMPGRSFNISLNFKF